MEEEREKMRQEIRDKVSWILVIFTNEIWWMRSGLGAELWIGYSCPFFEDLEIFGRAGAYF